MKPVAVENDVVCTLGNYQAAHMSTGLRNPLHADKTIVVSHSGPSGRSDLQSRHQLGCSTGWLSVSGSSRQACNSSPSRRNAGPFRRQFRVGSIRANGDVVLVVALLRGQIFDLERGAGGE